jgi:hypothetical protein
MIRLKCHFTISIPLPYIKYDFNQAFVLKRNDMPVN